MTAATVLQGDRAKALRPLARRERLAALEDALAAWDRCDWFEAHELLEPAWMGTADPAERDLYQGLIKLAAAFVHRERGNALGLAKNLHGARERLARAARRQGRIEGIDVEDLTAAVDLLLAADGSARLDAVAPRIARIPS